MKQVITIGGATQDIFIIYAEPESLQLPQKNNKQYIVLEEGEKIEVTQLHYALGGGATNSATTFTKLGLLVHVFCKIGTDSAGDVILKMLTSAGIDTTHIIRDATHQTGTSFILPSPTGNRAILAYRGANALLQEHEIPFNAIDAADIIYISSLAHDSAELLLRISKHAHERGKLVACNPGKQQLQTPGLMHALAYVDIFALNMSEAHAFQDASTWDMQEYFTRVHALGPKIVIVTDGANGVHVSVDRSHPSMRSVPEHSGRTGSPAEGWGKQTGSVYFYPSIPVHPVNTVGAGDAFTSCFVGMLALGHDIPTAIQAGLHNSASVLQHNDAQTGILSCAELVQKIKSF